MHTHITDTHIDINIIYFMDVRVFGERDIISEFRERMKKNHSRFAHGLHLKSNDASALCVCWCGWENALLACEFHLGFLFVSHLVCALFESFSVFNFHLQIFLCVFCFFEMVTIRMWIHKFEPHNLWSRGNQCSQCKWEWKILPQKLWTANFMSNLIPSKQDQTIMMAHKNDAHEFGAVIRFKC